MAVKSAVKPTRSSNGKNGKAKIAAKKMVPARKRVGFVPTKLKLRRPVPSDIAIAQEAKLKPILQVAEELGIRPNELELFGPYKAKVKLEILERLKNRPNGKYIDVTAFAPPPLVECKPTTPVSLSKALGTHYCKKVITAIRQSSQGPI